METLRLYRAILRSAARFPSIKRKAIIADIKTTFRENRELSGNALATQLDVAKDGLFKLKQYEPLKTGNKQKDWHLDLSRAPSS